MLNIGMVAGELSGDVLGGHLIKSLHEMTPLSVTGVGGETMHSAGCNSLYELNRLAVMGLIEPLFHLHDLLKIRRGLKKYFLQNKPDVFVGVDAPDFNLGLEISLRKAGIPVVHYVSPSVWAWRKKRIFKIAKAVDLILTLFPFEADFYQKHHIPVVCVGHPLADIIPLQPDKMAARKSLGLESDATYIALLPGSRQNEIKYLADTFIQSACQVLKQYPAVKFITSAATSLRDAEFKSRIQALAPDLPIQFFIQKTHDVMAAADLILVTSGTATLEAMLFKRPMVIAYRMAELTYQIARHLVKVPFIGLSNLLANELLAPEFIQHDATPENISGALLDFLDNPEKISHIERRYADIHLQLRGNASLKAAHAIMTLVKGLSPHENAA